MKYQIQGTNTPLKRIKELTNTNSTRKDEVIFTRVRTGLTELTNE